MSYLTLKTNKKQYYRRNEYRISGDKINIFTVFIFTEKKFNIRSVPYGLFLS